VFQLQFAGYSLKRTVHRLVQNRLQDGGAVVWWAATEGVLNEALPHVQRRPGPHTSEDKKTKLAKGGLSKTAWFPPDRCQEVGDNGERACRQTLSLQRPGCQAPDVNAPGLSGGG